MNFIKKYLPIIVIVMAMAIVYFSGLTQYLSIEKLRTYHKSLDSLRQLHPIALPVLFCVIYTVSTALSIPGGLVLTLTGGYLFPQPYSTIYVVCSASLGATLIFLAARTALRDIMKKKSGPYLQSMEKGFRENAASYMLFLRFVPIFPFWLVNIAPAFFDVSLFTYIWTTFIGIIPGTLVLTLAGGGLENILNSNESFSLSTIFNTEINLALVLLGIVSLVPIIWKKLR